ncbi:MAG: alpha-glucosidase [Spirochaetales bacterium]
MTHWWQEASIYQVYLRSFYDSNGDGIGDLPGATQQLDYLSWLGIDAVWLSPIHPSPNRDYGYDVSDYYAIHPDYGTLEDFDTFVAEAGRRNIRVLMDLVVNHTSDRHPWFADARDNPDSQFRRWYHIRRGDGAGGPPNNWESFFGGSAWSRLPGVEDLWYLHLFSPEQIDLNWDNPQVRDEVCRIMEFWADRGVAGYRLDVINMISKDPSFPDAPEDNGDPRVKGSRYYVHGPRLHEHLQELRRRVAGPRNLFLIGECPAAGTEEARALAGFDRGELDLILSMEQVELDHGPGGHFDPQPFDPRTLRTAIDRWQSRLQGEAWTSLYFSSHDQPRVVSRYGNDRAYHDACAKAFALLLFAQRGTPIVYYGEELGMTNPGFDSETAYRDIDTIRFIERCKAEGRPRPTWMPAVRKMSRDNARTPMQWTAGTHAGFSVAKPWIAVNPDHVSINVEHQRGKPDSVLAFTRALIALRRSRPTLVHGTYRRLSADDNGIIAFYRVGPVTSAGAGAGSAQDAGSPSGLTPDPAQDASGRGFTPGAGEEVKTPHDAGAGSAQGATEKLFLVVVNASDEPTSFEMPGSGQRADWVVLAGNYPRLEEGTLLGGSVDLEPWAALLAQPAGTEME